MRSTPPAPLSFYATPPHRCSYLPAREAVTVFADPMYRKDKRLYSRLSEAGFRRSGEHLYVPACNGCAACVPVRVPVHEFTPSRSQRRVYARNAALEVRSQNPVFNEAHFRLYQRYVNARHRGGGMDDPTREEFTEFLASDWSETVFHEFRRGHDLVAVAVTDYLENGLSAVYTFFDPDFPSDGLGVYAILWQIEQAKRLGFDWCYLGYWIKDSPKMRYKANFRPQEHYLNGGWQR